MEGFKQCDGKQQLMLTCQNRDYSNVTCRLSLGLEKTCTVLAGVCTSIIWLHQWDGAQG